MRILLITDNFLPHIGGSRIYFYNLCKNLPPGSVVVLTRKILRSEDFDRLQNFKIYRVKFWNLPWKWLKSFDLPQYLCLFVYGLFLAMKERVDIIHCGEVLPTGMAGFILSRLLNRPYIIYTFAEDITIISKLRTEAKLLRFVLKHADKVIATCAFVEGAIKGLGVDSGKIPKVLPGLDEEFLKDEFIDAQTAKRDLGLEGQKIILTVARLIERKGHAKVIEALPKVIEKVQNVTYLIVGSGPEEKKLKDLVKANNLNEHVRFYQEIEQGQLRRYYKACDLFVMPNRRLSDGDTEGFGIVFLEAGALGKPVIGGKAGGTSNSIIDGVTGLRIDGENTDGLASSIINLLTDESYARKMGEAGRQRVINEFSWKDKAMQVYQISKELCEN